MSRRPNLCFTYMCPRNTDYSVGRGVLDTACARTVAAAKWPDAVRDELEKPDVPMELVPMTRPSVSGMEKSSREDHQIARQWSGREPLGSTSTQTIIAFLRQSHQPLSKPWPMTTGSVFKQRQSGTSGDECELRRQVAEGRILFKRGPNCGNNKDVGDSSKSWS